MLKEQDIVDSYISSFQVSWRTISQVEEFRQKSTEMTNQQEALRTAAKNVQRKKEWIFKTAKNALFNFNFIQTWFFCMHRSFDLKCNKLYKSFVIRACHLLQNLTEIMPTEEIK